MRSPGGIDGNKVHKQKELTGPWWRCWLQTSKLHTGSEQKLTAESSKEPKRKKSHDGVIRRLAGFGRL